MGFVHHFWSFIVFLQLTLDVQAGLYYDTVSCQTYQTLLDKGFTSAFFMIERALEAVGEPGTQGTLWTFPDAETKDMAARIFGDSTTKPKNPKDRVWTISERMTLIKNNFKYMLDNFKPAEIPDPEDNNDDNGERKKIVQGTFINIDVHKLGQEDILVYCDLERLKKSRSSNWYDPTRTVESSYSQSDYNTCKSGTTLALTGRIVGNRQIMQLCRMDKVAEMKYKVLADRENVWTRNRGSFKDFCLRLIRNKIWEADYYDLFDHTLVHEMSHCIISSDKVNEVYTLLRTGDEGEGGGYHWNRVHELRKSGSGRTNADSYAFFALGAWMLHEKQTKISNDGCLEQLKEYQMGSVPQNVDNTWAAPAQKRAVHEPSEINYASGDLGQPRAHPLEMRQFVTSISVIDDLSSIGTGVPNSTFIWSSPRNTSATWVKTGASRNEITSVESTAGTSSSFFGAPNITFTWSSSKTSSTTRHRSAGTLDGVTSSTLEATNTTIGLDPSTSSQVAIPGTAPLLSNSATQSNSDGAQSSTGTWNNSSIGISPSSRSPLASTGATSPVSSLASQSSASSISTRNSMSSLSPTESGSSTGTTVLQVTSSAQPGQTPTSTTTTKAPGLPPSFFSQTPTTTPDGQFLLCPALTSCLGPTPTWLERMVAGTDLFIPEITNLAAVPTKKVKQNEDDDDNLAIIFAKLTLPTDKCNKLPKPKAGGLVGFAANVANKVVDAVMDAACNIEFPVIEGNLPDWLDFTKFPGLNGYIPPPPPNPAEPEDPVTTGKPTSTSSSDCFKTAVPTCEATAIVSGNSTSYTTSCRTVEACSQTGATETTSTTLSCSSTTVSSCRVTNIVSGSITKGFTTECSTIATCSGSDATTTTDSTVIPSGTTIPHPVEGEEWKKQLECFQDLMEQEQDPSDGTMASCLGIPFLPLTPEAITTSPGSSSPMSSTSVASTTEASSTQSDSTAASAISASPSASPSLGSIWLCTDYLGDIEDTQCSCDPIGCTGDDCASSVILTKGKDGCNDKCEGCIPLAITSSTSENPTTTSVTPISTSSSTLLSSTTPSPSLTAVWTCMDTWLANAQQCQEAECAPADVDRMKTECSCTKSGDGCSSDSTDEACIKTLTKGQDGCNDDCEGCDA